MFPHLFRLLLEFYISQILCFLDIMEIFIVFNFELEPMVLLHDKRLDSENPPWSQILLIKINFGNR